MNAVDRYIVIKSENRSRMRLHDLQKLCHEGSKANGWWHTSNGTRISAEAAFVEKIALMHSELSEALEEFRHGKRLGETYYRDASGQETVQEWDGEDVINKPEGIPSELADVLIRLLDLAGAADINLELAVARKLAFNDTRGHRHGGKVI